MTRQRSIHTKPIVYRRAVAVGDLRLGPASRASLGKGRGAKGDPLPAAELAGLLALKRTPELIPHCHPIPLSGAQVEVVATRAGVRARVEVEALWRTGVEMEALVGVTIALLTVWDMVKELEKDPKGQYPNARLGPVRVLSKEKRPISETS
ncbi:MAG: cyclic pyranopterin monophosphate synthase MoaC [Thermoplasmata archaeon]|nr:cyclic pyranopterin monophosphate synthase MoaC [Thermoplasmata archaeon]